MTVILQSKTLDFVLRLASNKHTFIKVRAVALLLRILQLDGENLLLMARKTNVHELDSNRLLNSNRTTLLTFFNTLAIVAEPQHRLLGQWALNSLCTQRT